MRSEVSQGPLRPPNHRLERTVRHHRGRAAAQPGRQCDGAEDRFMVVRSRRRTSVPGRSSTIGIRPKPEAHDRPLSDGGLTLIRI